MQVSKYTASSFISIPSLDTNNVSETADINESITKFNVNENYEIRFGMGAVKGVGQAAVNSIISEREANGPFKDIYDFVKRVELRTVNKKTIENLVLAGGFDSFEFHRGRYFYIENTTTNLEKLIKYGANYQEQKNSAQTSLFGDFGGDSVIEDVVPMLPDCEKWNMLQRLSKEKEVVGIYISSHPLDDFKHELKMASNCSISDINANEDNFVNKEVSICGMMSNIQHRIAKNGNEFGIFTFSDYTDSMDIMVFGGDYLKYRHFMQENMFLNLKLNISKKEFKNKEGNVTQGRVYKNITNILLLNEIVEKQAEKMTVKIEVPAFSEETFTKLSDIMYKYQGDKLLKIQLIDPKDYLNNLDLPAGKIKINICRDLLKELDELQEITFKLN